MRLNVHQELLDKMPKHLFRFLDTLADEDIDQLNLIDKRLVAKIYQAGAQFSIDAVLEMKDEHKL